MEAAPRRLSRARLAWLCGWVIQGGLALLVPLVADEAYYQDWGERLALGYLDHPPGIAWWSALGGGHPRLLGWLLGPVSAWLLADTARRLGASSPWLAPALMVWTPLGLVGGALGTPDIPLVFGWTVLLWALFAERTWLVGVSFAWCLWSKSTALVALPGLLWLLGPRRWWALALSAALYAPHLWWSAHNEWLPWSFQWQRTGARANLFEFLGGQLALVTPILLWEMGRAWAAPNGTSERRLRALSLPVVLAFAALAALTRVEGNWACFAWPAAFIALAARGRARMDPLAIALTLAAVVAAPFVARSNQSRVGDAGGPLAGLPRVAARYQERALIEPSPLYLRALGHRPSQYDRWGADPVPDCDFVYLADARALGDRCRGRAQMPATTGRPITVCRCPNSTKINDSPK